MKPSTLTCFILFLAGIALFLAQLWLHYWNDVVFVKLILTDGACLAVALIWAFLVREGKADKKIHSGLD